MACGTIVDNAVTLHSQLYSRAIKAACLGKTEEKRYASINIKPLSTMIALVMKHFFSLAKDIHALLYYCLDMYPLYEHSEYFLLNVLSSPDCR